MTDDKIYKIALGDIEISDQNVRLTRQTKDLDELAASIKRHGLLQPVVLIGDYGEPPYELISGQRRFSAHERLKKKTIKAVFAGELSKEQAILHSLVENVQRVDPEFREKVLRAYEYKCAVCGFDVRLDHYPIALEAAHIKWHQAGGPDVEVNGLALCALHHKLFDREAFTLSKNFEVKVSDRAYGTIGFNEWLMKFHGEKIKYPQRKNYLPDNSFRAWHVREVFQGDFREKDTLA